VRSTSEVRGSFSEKKRWLGEGEGDESRDRKEGGGEDGMVE
jgi:hypothetical protein